MLPCYVNKIPRNIRSRNTCTLTLFEISLRAQVVHSVKNKKQNKNSLSLSFSVSRCQSVSVPVSVCLSPPPHSPQTVDTVGNCDRRLENCLTVALQASLCNTVSEDVNPCLAGVVTGHASLSTSGRDVGRVFLLKFSRQAFA